MVSRPTCVVIMLSLVGISLLGVGDALLKHNFLWLGHGLGPSSVTIAGSVVLLPIVHQNWFLLIDIDHRLLVIS